MVIKTIRIKNFRCIKDAELQCEDLTILIGPNGSGKSAFLKALDFFYDPNANYSQEDFYNGNTSEPIIIAVTYGDLTDEEKKLFAPYLDGDTLMVEKELNWPLGRTSQKYFSSILGIPDFQRVRSLSKAADKRSAFQELINSGKFPGLPKLPGNASVKEIEATLKKWENEHREQCQWVRDDGQFFGFKEVGQARLERFTRFLLVPAVRDASEDATEGRGRVISEIMDLVVRNTLAQRQELKKLFEETQKQYEEIMDPHKLNELVTLADRMNETLNMYAPGAKIQINWLPGEAVKVPMPEADVKLIEDGYPTAVERAGHGLQRAFILTALQHLTIAQAQIMTRDNGGQQSVPDIQEGPTFPEENKYLFTLPNLIIGIEEPELYQHPSRQRHLARVLFQLARGNIPGVAKKVQIIYSTHSPLFVDLQRFNNIRLLRKERLDYDKPKQTRVFQASAEKVTREIERADGVRRGTYDDKNIFARLYTLLTPWTNEGFFADVVILTEGESDRAAILGVAKAMGYDLEGMDVAIIPCMGKTNLHKAAAIFKSFGIPIYVVWDSDAGKHNEIENNHRLLRLFDERLEDYPSKVKENFACFKVDLENTLKEELNGELYDRLLEKYMRQFGYNEREQAKKIPLIIEGIISEASSEGKESITLRRIIENILKLKKLKKDKNATPICSF